jgi:hypothetical protein
MTTINPEVGMGARFTVYTDTHACTVVSVTHNGKRAVLQRDKATLINRDELKFTPGGFYGHTEGNQRYAFERDTSGATYTVTRRVRRDGSVTWKQVGIGTHSQGGTARFGERIEYFDFNF